MALILYGHKVSLCTRRVLLVLAEKGLDFELRSIDFLTGENKRPPYTDKHPFGVIPLLEDGSFTVYESRAISRYLATKYQQEGASLIPSADDIQGSALFEQWASVEYSQFYDIAERVLIQKLFNPARGVSSDESVTAVSVQRLYEKLDVLNTVLAKQHYMGGEDFSLIDVFYMPAVDLLHAAGEGHAFETRSNLKTWWEKVSSRKSWKQIASS